MRSVLIMFGMSIKEFPVACVFHILCKIETSKTRRHIVEMYASAAKLPRSSLLTSKLFGFN